MYFKDAKYDDARLTHAFTKDVKGKNVEDGVVEKKSVLSDLLSLQFLFRVDALEGSCDVVE